MAGKHFTLGLCVLLLSAAAFAQNNPDNQVYNNQSLQPFPDSGSTVFVMCGNGGCDPLGKLDLTSSSLPDSIPLPATDGPGVVGVNLVGNDAPIGAGPMGTGFSGVGGAGMPYQMGQAYFHQAANLIGSIPGMFNLTHTGPGPVTYQGQTYWSDGMKIGMVDPAWTKPGFSIEYNFDAMSDQNLINGVDEVIKGNSPSFEGLAGPRPAIEPGQLGKQLTFARDAYTDYLEASTRYQQAMHTPTTSFRQLLEAGDDMERATIKLQSAGWMFQGMPRPIN